MCQGLVQASNKKHSALQSFKAVSAEEYDRVVLELKETQGHHQDDLKKIQERHLAELQSLRDTKSKLLKEQQDMFLFFHGFFLSKACPYCEAVV